MILYVQICYARINMRGPEFNRFCYLGNDFAIIGFTFFKRQLKTDLIVGTTTTFKGVQQWFRMDAALRVNSAVKGRWPPLSIKACFIWIIGETFGTAYAQA